jgi:hypothetical protein
MIKLTQIAANHTQVTVGRVQIAFSYETPIGFSVDWSPWILRENSWGPTTGKHLNYYDGGTAAAKAKRVSHDDFPHQLARALRG